MGEREGLSMEEVLDLAWGYFALCQITGRDAAGHAERFILLSKHASGTSAKRDLEYYVSEGFDMLVVPAFPNSEGSFRAVIGGGREETVGMLVEPEDVARFFRSYLLPPDQR